MDFQPAEKEESKNQVESKSEKVLGKCLEPKPKGQTDKAGVDENDKRLKSNSCCFSFQQRYSQQHCHMAKGNQVCWRCARKKRCPQEQDLE